MSFVDGFLNLFKVQDDDFDDDYDYDDYDDDEDEKSSSRKKLFSGSKKSDDEDIEANTVNDRPKFASKGKVVPMKQTSRGLEVVVIRPESMEDASEITDTLLSGKAVVLNLEGIHVDVAQRVIDYSAGSCYAIRGNLQKITNYIFLVTPPNVDISGDIPEIVAGGIDLTSFKNNDTKFLIVNIAATPGLLPRVAVCIINILFERGNINGKMY